MCYEKVEKFETGVKIDENLYQKREDKNKQGRRV